MEDIIIYYFTSHCIQYWYYVRCINKMSQSTIQNNYHVVHLSCVLLRLISVIILRRYD